MTSRPPFSEMTAASRNFLVTSGHGGKFSSNRLHRSTFPPGVEHRTLIKATRKHSKFC